MPNEASWDRSLVDWALVPAPEISPLSWRARSSCPHGSRDVIVVGKATTLLASIPHMCADHAREMGCRCTSGTFDLAAPDPTPKEDPGDV